jgi:hypothetical protein
MVTNCKSTTKHPRLGKVSLGDSHVTRVDAVISRRYLPCGRKRRNWTIVAPCF